MRRKSISGVSATIRTYTPLLYKDCVHMRTLRGLEFLRTYIPETLLICAENPVMECHAQKIQKWSVCDHTQIYSASL